MPIDASIPLSVQTPQVDLGQIMGNALKLRAMKQEIQTQNALKQIFAQPDAVDPKTGQPTANTLAKVTRISPETGLKLTASVAEAQERQAQTEHAQSETQKAQAQAARDQLSESLGVYDADLKSGTVDPKEAERTLKTGLHDWIYKNSGFDKAHADALWSRAEKMSPTQLRALTLTAEQRAAQEHEDKVETRQEAAEKERERHDLEVERNADRRESLAAKREGRMAAIESENLHLHEAEAFGGLGKWEVLHDPKTQTDYRYNPVTGKSTTLDGAHPYEPQGAEKMHGGTARSAAALAAQKYAEEHPNATAEDIAKFAADFARENRGAVAFGTGKQGDAVRSFNVGIAHLNTLDGLVEGLDNGDIQTLNRFKQKFKEEFGSSAPTNFDAAKAIVGDEIIKAVVGGGGALADRENAANQISRAKSPAQLRGVIKTYKELMGGQLKGLKKQYGDATGRTDFDDHLMPDTKRELGIGQGPRKKPLSAFGR